MRVAGRRRCRPAGEGPVRCAPFPCIWIDAAYVKCRDSGHVSSCALVTAIGVGADGYRRILGLDAIDAESYARWPAFLPSLRERGPPASSA